MTYQQDSKIATSLVLHVGLVVVLFVLHKLNFISTSLNPKINPKKVFIKSAIRVDVVGMPKFTQKELKTMDTSMPKAQKEVKVEAPVKVETLPDKGDFIKPKKKASFQDLIKGLKNKQVKKSKGSNKKMPRRKSTGRENGAEQAKLNKLILEGNKISKGSSLTGTQAEDQSYTVFEQYIVGLPDHVRPQWKLPSYLLDKQLQCRIQVFINSGGGLVKAAIVETSGDSEYDNKALQAVRESAPFPTPPSDIVKRLIQGEVILGFPL